MMTKTTATAFLLFCGALASPIAGRQEKAARAETSTPEVKEWSAGWVTEFPIHESCNATLRNQLAEALAETQQLAQHAKEHLLRWGHESQFVQKYFGEGNTAVPIGWYERIISADKTGMLFRCDDPDKNCATQSGWAGHWRGSNATEETVICPLSFEKRRPLSSVCNLGYNVANSPRNTYWATDLMHRVLHVPTVSEEIVEHYAGEYPEVLELAKTNSSYSGIDSNTLQYFAIDVWAYDIAAPGVGCTGEPEEKKTEDAPATTASSAPSATSEAPKECHTHSDGVVHCA